MLQLYTVYGDNGSMYHKSITVFDTFWDEEEVHPVIEATLNLKSGALRIITEIDQGHISVTEQEALVMVFNEARHLHTQYRKGADIRLDYWADQFFPPTHM